MTRAGDQLGAYELLRPLGAGGMAETFVAIRRGPANFEQRVCLKRILPGVATDPMFVELFLDEARLLARLQCANIVHVYDFGEVDGTYYMALELIDGCDLEGLLSTLRDRAERMPEQIALYIVTEVLVALSYAHSLEIDGEPQGIVHRDISPSNILLSKTGEVKLTDFGIAKARGRSHRTQTGHTKGKVAYMSPEQVRAEELDGRSDLFAVGVVLFELLTGAHPFDANTDFALQINIMSGKRRPLAELLPNASPRITKLLDTLLATDRVDRPASAADAIELIPPLDAQFTLQRGLQALVKERIGIKGSPANTGSAARPVSANVAPGHSDTALASAPVAASAVNARGTTAGGPPKSGLKPILWVGLGLLVLVLGIGFALGRRGELAQLIESQKSQAPAADRLAPPAIPQAPTPSTTVTPVPLPTGATTPTNPSIAEPTHPALPTSPATAEPVAVDQGASESPREHGKHGHRHGERHGDRHGEEGEPLAPTSQEPATVIAKEPEVVAPVDRSVAPPMSNGSTRAPSLAAPAAPIPGPPLTAPRNDPSQPARAPYVTPSGRVVLPAPPL